MQCNASRVSIELLLLITCNYNIPTPSNTHVRTCISSQTWIFQNTRFCMVKHQAFTSKVSSITDISHKII